MRADRKQLFQRYACHASLVVCVCAGRTHVWGYPADTFTLQGGRTMYEDDIAWESDREDKFKRVPDAVQAQYASSVQFIHETYPTIPASKGVEDEHFIVWMRTAALPTFRKLYGRIEDRVAAGSTLTFNITSRTSRLRARVAVAPT